MCVLPSHVSCPVYFLKCSLLYNAWKPISSFSIRNLAASASDVRVSSSAGSIRIGLISRTTQTRRQDNVITCIELQASRGCIINNNSVVSRSSIFTYNNYNTFLHRFYGEFRDVAAGPLYSVLRFFNRVYARFQLQNYIWSVFCRAFELSNWRRISVFQCESCIAEASLL